MGWLNRVSWNIREKSATCATFQPDRSWLKAVAPRNMDPMFSTRAVFQNPMLPLKAVLAANRRDMSVTRLVFHRPISLPL